MHSSSVSPATKRPAPRRMPWRRTSALHARLSAAARIPLRRRRVERDVQLCDSSQSLTSRIRRSISVRCPSAVVDPRLDAGDALGEPVAVRHRDEPVVARRAGAAPAARCPRPRSPTARRTRSRRRSSRRRRAPARGGRTRACTRRIVPVSTARPPAPSSDSRTCDELLGLRPRASRRPRLDNRGAAPPRRRAPCRTRRWFSSPIPSSQSSPSAPYGRDAARLAAAVSRSSQSAAHASDVRSAAGDAPGREALERRARRRSPRRRPRSPRRGGPARASSCRSRGGRSRSGGCPARAPVPRAPYRRPDAGVPWWTTTGKPVGSPASCTSSARSSFVWMVAVTELQPYGPAYVATYAATLRICAGVSCP